MKKIIRFSNNANAYSDIKYLELAKTITQELVENKNLEVEFSYSNQVFLDCMRAEILKVDYRLNNKIKWLVEDIEVHFTKHLRSNDIWKYLPNISEDALIIILDSKELVEKIDKSYN